MTVDARNDGHSPTDFSALRREEKNKNKKHTYTKIMPKESEVGTSRQPPSSSATKRRKCDASGGPSGATRYTASLQRTPPDRRHTGPLSADSTRTAERFTVRSYPAATGRCVRLHARTQLRPYRKRRDLRLQNKSSIGCRGGRKRRGQKESHGGKVEHQKNVMLSRCAQNAT